MVQLFGPNRLWRCREWASARTGGAGASPTSAGQRQHLQLSTGGSATSARTAAAEELRKGAEWRANKLTASEYDETTWLARTFMAFTTQRLSVAVQYSAAQEVAEALGLSVAADPRAAP